MNAWLLTCRLADAMSRKLGMTIAATRCPLGTSQAFGFLLPDGSGRVYGQALMEATPTQALATRIYQEMKACCPVEPKVKAQRLRDDDY